MASSSVGTKTKCMQASKKIVGIITQLCEETRKSLFAFTIYHISQRVFVLKFAKFGIYKDICQKKYFLFYPPINPFNSKLLRF